MNVNLLKQKPEDSIKRVLDILSPSAIQITPDIEFRTHAKFSDENGDIFLISEGRFDLFIRGSKKKVGQFHGPAIIGIQSLFHNAHVYDILLHSPVEISVISPFQAKKIIQEKNLWRDISMIIMYQIDLNNFLL